MTYGLGRAEILSAQANGVTLLVLSVVIVVDALRRLVTPPHVNGAPVLIVALVGVVVNLAAAAILASGHGDPPARRSLNLEGSYRHISPTSTGSSPPRWRRGSSSPPVLTAPTRSCRCSSRGCCFTPPTGC